ncbi:MAG TPA: DUF892 family protein [Chitinophagaceae bacterium]|nr:DUF892 family protein [Chitinophagaceae bacterium]
MEKMNDLRDLLKHEVLDLYSAEEQIIAALPAMIEKAGNPALKEALQQHLQITEQQRARLDQVQQLLMEGEEMSENGGGEEGGEKRGFIAGLFRRNREEKQECLGTKGLIEEGQKVMQEPMQPEVLDAAIIGCAQKIEHYEICGYGTAKAYAVELGLTEVERLLDVTLNEEYDADDILTELAVGRLNREAERGTNSRGGASRGGRGNSGVRSASSKGSGRTSGGNGKQGGGSKSASKGASKSAGAKASSKGSGGRGGSKAATKSSAQSKGGAASKSSSKASSKGNKSASKGASKGGSKSAAKKGSSARGRR